MLQTNDYQRQVLHALMAEGYRAMSAENLQEAEEALNLTSDVMLRDG